jgi:hypothetical protein
MRAVWDRLLDFAIAARLGILDWLAPLPETPVDRAIREEGERRRKAFPWLDEASAATAMTYADCAPY